MEPQELITCCTAGSLCFDLAASGPYFHPPPIALPSTPGMAVFGEILFLSLTFVHLEKHVSQVSYASRGSAGKWRM